MAEIQKDSSPGKEEETEPISLENTDIDKARAMLKETQALIEAEEKKKGSKE